jgi:hypothetical protein
VTPGVGASLAALALLGSPFTGSTTPPANRATVIADDGGIAAGWARTDMVDRWPVY